MIHMRGNRSLLDKERFPRTPSKKSYMGYFKRHLKAGFPQGWLLLYKGERHEF